MSVFNCILIGEELISKIRRCDVAWGKIGGFSKENVLGVVSVDIGTHEFEICKASLKVFKHRFFSGNYNEKIGFWVKIKKGTIQKIVSFDSTIKEISNWLPEELFKIIEESTIEHIFLIEEDSDEVLNTTIFKGKENWIVIPEEIEILEEDPNPFLRIDGLVPLEEMKEKTAVIVGLGSGGAAIALELAAAGVGSLHLFDKERLNSVNLFRHICDVRDLGRYKVDAVEDVIKDHTLKTEIIKCDSDIIDEPAKLIESIQCADIVICATDNTQSRSLVNYLCVKLNKALILVCTFDNAKIGEVIRVIPNTTACYECTRIHLKEQGALLEEKSSETVLPYSSQTKERGLTSRGTRTDVMIVAAISSKVALMTLSAKDFGNLSFNFITWGATRNTDFISPYYFRMPFSTNYTNYNIHPECPICGSLAPEIQDVNIEEEYDEIMQKI
ncbi:hypothetical protein FRZ06_11390 [Anoxybacterium hadale]|uniref:Uncharacterized protein n=1 Tax=Anoxybacterium hadale TaxID=3408580 RepID=A0ACD1ABL1_9FIRM|nr:hypothetical protein FRZ06_11390 [Clostridiales bacterium]